MFPPDSYTPFGYLANPTAFARSWHEGTGGALRSSEERPGFGWWYPFHQRARAAYTLDLALELDGRRYATRRDWQALGLHASRHGARTFTYAAASGDISWSAAFFLAHEDGLVCTVTLSTAGRNECPVRVTFRACAWQANRSLAVTARDSHVLLEGSDVAPPHALSTSGFDALARPADSGSAELYAEVVLQPGETQTLVAALGRGAEPLASARSAVAIWESAKQRAEQEDDAFWEGAARLAGAWPAAWRRGWVYDLETARMCLSAAGGVYQGVWPIWSANWPRSVLAEAALDMPRLALGAPELAQQALLTLFRAAPQPNVPCVFMHGEPNMVAADGHACGTSLAWCLPFHNLALLDRSAPNPEWRAALYPHLAALLDWWLDHRADAQGWLSYHCTWESGEDGTPRLDPTGSGDAVIRGLVRPVELQAAAAQAATLLADWASGLGKPAEAARWRQVRSRYVRRTRALWDAGEQRFRDQDAQGIPLGPCGDPPYWGDDPCQRSVLALTAALGGVATTAQRRAMAEREIERFLGRPWCQWPSWSWTVAEAANAVGRRDLSSRLALSIVARVYPENDRRPTESDGGPLPGVAREWWPLDLSGWNAGEAYGWGGTTAMLLLRHVLGILEPPASGRRLAVQLAPAFPEEMLQPGTSYAVENLPYGGQHLDVTYTVRGSMLATTVRVRETGAQRSVRLRNYSRRTLRL